MGEWTTRLTSEESQSLTFCSSLCLSACGECFEGSVKMGYKDLGEQAGGLFAEEP
jgi:hypothetical protein